MQLEMMMKKEMATAPLIGEAETGLLPMEEAMVVVDAPQVHTTGIEVALIMGMARYQVLDLSEGAVLIMPEPQALSMIDIKAALLLHVNDLDLDLLHVNALDLLLVNDLDLLYVNGLDLPFVKDLDLD